MQKYDNIIPPPFIESPSGFLSPNRDRDTAELIETDDSGDASNPQIATDANGNVIAVWDQIVGGDRNIYTNRFD